MDIFAESYPHLKGGAIKDFKSIMVAQGYWDDKSWNKTEKVYTFANTDTTINFLSVDNIGKAKGARRDTAFVNEAQHAMTWEVFDQIMVRTQEVIWLDWNPSEEFWYDEKIKNNIDHDFLRLTYLDCLDALSANIIESIESHKNDKNWWNIYGLGLHGVIEGRIYEDWQIIETIPHEARLERRGLDFGYSNDPTSIIDIYSYNGGFILDEICYRTSMRNNEIAALLKGQQDKVLTIADSAEPKSIDEIKLAGINIIGAIKGPGSINKGIDFVQQQRISITKRSTNTIKEYRNYLWKEDKHLAIINTPQDMWNHSMDAIRYGLGSYRSRVSQKFTANNKITFK